MHKRSHILGQAGDLNGQVLDQVEGAIDVALNLHHHSASVQVMMHLPESKGWQEDLQVHEVALVWQALCNAGSAPASRTGLPPAQPL